ncbi:MAG: hypothetical protein DRP01_05695 [Archaeoglobales archaeon]|nr:MAG: hypothetical protein DRP01_05695 [Archaeoglobales archaeon]
MIAVVGCRLLAEILNRMNVEVKYIGDFYTTNDARIDVTLNGCGYDVPDAKFYSYPLTKDYREAKRQVAGCDAVVAHKYLEFFAKVSYDLGIPFMPNFVTFFFPDSIKFFDSNIPKLEYDTISYTLTCSLQAREILKLMNGEDVIVAPMALIVKGWNEVFYNLRT